jgi:hypothetical protein
MEHHFIRGSAVAPGHNINYGGTPFTVLRLSTRFGQHVDWHVKAHNDGEEFTVKANTEYNYRLIV